MKALQKKLTKIKLLLKKKKRCAVKTKKRYPDMHKGIESI